MFETTSERTLAPGDRTINDSVAFTSTSAYPPLHALAPSVQGHKPHLLPRPLVLRGEKRAHIMQDTFQVQVLSIPGPGYSRFGSVEVLCKSMSRCLLNERLNLANL